MNKKFLVLLFLLINVSAEIRLYRIVFQDVPLPKLRYLEVKAIRKQLLCATIGYYYTPKEQNTYTHLFDADGNVAAHFFCPPNKSELGILSVPVFGSQQLAEQLLQRLYPDFIDREVMHQRLITVINSGVRLDALEDR